MGFTPFECSWGWAMPLAGPRTADGGPGEEPRGTEVCSTQRAGWRLSCQSGPEPAVSDSTDQYIYNPACVYSLFLWYQVSSIFRLTSLTTTCGAGALWLFMHYHSFSQACLNTIAHRLTLCCLLLSVSSHSSSCGPFRAVFRRGCGTDSRPFPLRGAGASLSRWSPSSWPPSASPRPREPARVTHPAWGWVIWPHLPTSGGAVRCRDDPQPNSGMLTNEWLRMTKWQWFS